MKPGLLMLPSAVSDSRVHNILPNKIETDFQFSRASSATRVNHQGLIENVGYFSDELIQNGNFSELGSELVTNGDFATDSDWTKGQGWSIANGIATLTTHTASSSLNSTAMTVTSGHTYKIEVDVVSTSPGFRLYDTIGVVSYGLNVGKNIFYRTVSASSYTILPLGLAGATGSIQNISVKQVDPDDDWVINGEWEYVDNGVSITNATGGYNDSALYQLITLDSSKQYKATIDVSSISGSLRVYTGSFGAGFNISTAGEKSFILDLTSVGGRINLLPGNGSDVVIKSFSLVEVIGDKPRLDYDPTNPTCPHLLLEPQSTNSFRFSEDFAQNYWLKQNGSTVSSNQTISPEGIQNADTLVSANATNEQYLYNATLISVTSGNDVTTSCFVKKLDYDYFHLRFTSTGSVFTASSVWYNISNGTLGTVETGITAKIEDYGNGWYRCSATRTATGTGNARVRLQLASSDNASFVAGDGTKGTFIYGAQFEIQSYPTSYIPTAGAAETRVGESCFTPGIDNGILNQNAFTLLLDTSILNDTFNNFLELIILYNSSDPSTTNLRFESRTNGQVYVQHQNCVNSGANFNSATFGSNSVDFKNFLISCSTSEVKIWADSNKINDYSGSYVFAFDRIGFRNNTGIVETILKHNAVALYNRVLTDTESYTITSTQYSAYSGMVAALGNYTIPC